MRGASGAGAPCAAELQQLSSARGGGSSLPVAQPAAAAPRHAGGCAHACMHACAAANTMRLIPTNHNAVAQHSKLQAANCKLQAANCKLQVAGASCKCQVQVAAAALPHQVIAVGLDVPLQQVLGKLGEALGQVRRQDCGA